MSTFKQTEKSGHYYTIFCVLFTSLLLLSNMTMKLFKAPFFSDLALTSGLISYPLTFLITDTVTEVWGAKKAKNMVLMAFSMNLLMLLFIKSTIALPAHPTWFIPNNAFNYSSIHDFQNALSSVFSVSGYILIGSAVAYLVSQFFDIYVFDLIKRKTHSKHLWLRNNVSTCLSQLIDTFIMDGIVLFFGLGMDLKTCVLIGISVYIYKVIFALLDTPFVYLLTNFFKNKLGIKADVQEA